MEHLSGSVEHITFANTDTGFAVVELDAEGELVTAVAVSYTHLHGAGGADGFSRAGADAIQLCGL